MKAWFRVVLPGEGVGVGFLCFYAACYLPEIFYYLYGGEGDIPLEPASTVNSLHVLVICISTIVYAGFRVYAFHPAFSKDYRDWLRQTPWRWGLPLPYGPVHLVPQDVAVLAILSAFGWRHLGELWWIVPCLFLGMHSLFLLTAFLQTEYNRHAYLMALGLGGIVWLYHDPLRLKLLLLAIYGVSFHGLRHSLKRFDEWDWATFNKRICFDSEVVKARKLGWPYDSLGPHRNPTPVSVGWAAALAMLAGWWVLGVGVNFTHRDVRSVLCIAVSLGTLGLPIWRLLIYICGYAPPLSFWGRIVTRQWIIPGYDKVFVAPLLGLAVVVSLKWLILDFRVPAEIALPLVTAASVFVAFGCPPTLDEWRLTGNHRIVPAASKPEMQQIP